MRGEIIITDKVRRNNLLVRFHDLIEKIVSTNHTN